MNAINTSKLSLNQRTTFFTMFLKANGLYKKFFANIGDPKNDVNFDALIAGDIEYMFSGAFRWSDTPEGLDFWCKQARKWQEFLDTLSE